MFFFRIFNRARRRFGFWRTLLAAIVLLWAFAFAAKAFAAQKPGHTFKHDVPPITQPAHDWNKDAMAFYAGDWSPGCLLGSNCWETFSLQARMLPGPFRGPGTLNSQLLLTVSWDAGNGSNPCTDPVCLTTPPPSPRGKVVVVINGHPAGQQAPRWHWINSSGTQNPGDPYAFTYSAVFVSSPLSLGFACGSTRVAYGIWAKGAPFSTPHLTTTVPFYVFAGNCHAKHHRHR